MSLMPEFRSEIPPEQRKTEQQSTGLRLGVAFLTVFILIIALALVASYTLNAPWENLKKDIQQGNQEKIKAALEKKPELITMQDWSRGKGAKRDSGMSALHYAALNGNLEAVNLLVEKGADVYMREKKTGRIPLHYAALAPRNNLDIVHALVKAGAHPEDTDRDNNTVYSLAIANGKTELARVLAEEYPRVVTSPGPATGQKSTDTINLPAQERKSK